MGTSLKLNPDLHSDNSATNPRVEAGSNTSTLSLRVVGGDKKSYKYGELGL
jgi:hypothetical protein